MRPWYRSLVFYLMVAYAATMFILDGIFTILAGQVLSPLSYILLNGIALWPMLWVSVYLSEQLDKAEKALSEKQ